MKVVNYVVALIVYYQPNNLLTCVGEQYVVTIRQVAHCIL